MTRTIPLLLAATLALGGCNNTTPPPSDADPGTPPKPSVSHVGPSGPTVGLLATSHFAAYLAKPFDATLAGKYPVGSAGELHVVRYDGDDKKIADGVLTHDYVLSPDGRALFYVVFDLSTGPTTGVASLWYLSLDKGGDPRQIAAKMPVTVAGRTATGATVYAPVELTQESFFSPAGTFFLVGEVPAVDARAPDLHVIDVATGNDVYQRLNGAGAYQQLVLPDDTLIFQDTVGGVGVGQPPVQTLFSIQLPPSGAETTIMTRTSSFTPTSDLQKLIILDGAGGLWLYTIGGAGTSATRLADNVVQYALGVDANGPVMTVAADRSVHVVGFDGTKLLDLDAATAAADLTGPPFVGDSSHFYFWRNVETQNNRGTLLFVGNAAGATPVKVADAVSMQDFFVTSDQIVLMDNVDANGSVGEVALGGLDGSGLTSYHPGAHSPLGGLHLAAASGKSWVGLHIGELSGDAVTMTRDDSTLAAGTLALDDPSGHEAILSSQTHAFRFSPSAYTIAFNDGARYDATAGNWVGTLAFVDTYGSPAPVASSLDGVAEIGRIVGRHLFVSAPAAKNPGVYFVTY